MKPRLVPRSLNLLIYIVLVFPVSAPGAPTVSSVANTQPSFPEDVAQARAAAPFAGEPELLDTYPWTSPYRIAHEALAKEGRYEFIQPPDAPSMVKIINVEDRPLEVGVLCAYRLAVTQDRYMLAGEVRFENVVGDGYLEVWSTFSGARSYFSRTLAPDPAAPMGKLTGTSRGFRPFVLPFDATGSGAHPLTLDVRVVLPGPGRVILRQLRLFQFAPPIPGAATIPAAKLSGTKTLPVVSLHWLGIGVSVASTLLSVAAITLSALARRQQGHAFVLASTWTLMAAGFVLVGMGLAGWLSGWNASLWAMALIIGTIVSSVFGLGTHYFRQAYRDGEWRRMAALDTQG